IRVQFDGLGLYTVQGSAADFVFCFEVAADDKINRKQQSNRHANEQVGGQDGNDSEEEGQKLFPAQTPHTFIEFGLGQVVTGNDEDGCQRGIRNFIEQKRNQ